MKRSTLLSLLFALLLLLFSLYVLLDAFVIPRVYEEVAETSLVAEDPADAETDAETDAVTEAETEAETAAVPHDPVITENSYDDGVLTIRLTDYRQYDTTIHVADVTLSDLSRLRTALAKNTYGKNITQKTSAMAAQNHAILAINGDYYGARNKGYVIRGGVMYRRTPTSADTEDLVIWEDGSFSVVREGDYTAKELFDLGAKEVLSFGPGLISDGRNTADINSEVKRERTDNPRTAIAMIEPGHYLFVVADGRTAENKGLSLYELGEFLLSLGAQEAYNLDGGGSSTMVFNGKVVNVPTANGKKITERSVSDIVYLGS